MRHYRFIDYATQGYVALVGLLVLLFHNETVPQWRWLVLGHFGLVAMIHGMIVQEATGRHGALLRFVRHFYPILLYVPIYNETGHLNQMFARGMLDPWFIRLEEQIFGGQPSLLFMDRLPYLWVSEVFYVAYFSYYLMITGCGLALYRQDRRQFFHYISLVSVVFYACFLVYIFLPVVGPRIFYRDFGNFDLPAAVMPAQVPEFPAAVQKGLFYQIMAIIYHHFETPGAAFPSSHVAVAVTTLYFSFRYLRAIRWVHAVVVFLLCLSTVYCRYHYAVDVPAGLVMAALMIWAGNRLIRRLEGPAALPGGGAEKS
ncbi:MAG: phosphatase PAP2 family protein [Verrucomicrobiae bacterium]|nr:phosphatase PAP2 family protein [Verrucomicrobiae bacterium]